MFFPKNSATTGRNPFLKRLFLPRIILPDFRLRNGAESRRDSGIKPRVLEPWVLVSAESGNLNEVLDSTDPGLAGYASPADLPYSADSIPGVLANPGLNSETPLAFVEGARGFPRP